MLYDQNSPDFTLSFRWGICAMLVQEGPLLETKTSHVLAGKLKWDAQAFFRLASESSSYSKVTNSLGCTGLNVCFVSGSEARRWTMISCGALEQFFLRPAIASLRALFAPILAWRSFQTACLLILLEWIQNCKKYDKWTMNERYIFTKLGILYIILKHVFCLPMTVACAELKATADRLYFGLWQRWAVATCDFHFQIKNRMLRNFPSCFFFHFIILVLFSSKKCFGFLMFYFFFLFFFNFNFLVSKLNISFVLVLFILFPIVIFNFYLNNKQFYWFFI